MRWPLRNQILIPFLTIQIITLVASIFVSSLIAIERAKVEIESRLHDVQSTLRAATYPLTPPILDQLRHLTGAHFTVFDDQHRLVNSTLTNTAEHPNWESIENLTATIETDLVDRRQLLKIGTESYFAGRFTSHYAENNFDVLVLYPERKWTLIRWQVITPHLLLGIGLIIPTVIVSLMLASRFGQRIKRMQQQVDEIGQSHFEQLIPDHQNDELRDLTIGINQMATLLGQSFRLIREAERSSMLTQLVGGLSHQLRNALTGARLSLQLHQRACPLKEDQAIERTLMQLQLTEEQIKALLRLARGEAMQKTPAVLDAIVQETLSLITPFAQHQKIELKSDLQHMGQSVSDADGVRGALLNILINAFEASGPRGRVEIKTGQNAQSAFIRISDNGPGIPQDLLASIFTPFFTTKPEGVGLGLTLARQAVHECGGNLAVESTAQGCSFLLTFPTSVPSKPPVAENA
jgi:signal transduction histidine kinase